MVKHFAVCAAAAFLVGATSREARSIAANPGGCQPTMVITSSPTPLPAGTTATGAGVAVFGGPPGCQGGFVTGTWTETCPNAPSTICTGFIPTIRLSPPKGGGHAVPTTWSVPTGTRGMDPNGNLCTTKGAKGCTLVLVLVAVAPDGTASVPNARTVVYQ